MDDKIKLFIESEMADFGSMFQSERRTFLRQKISTSGKLSQSIEYDIDKQSRQDTITMLIAFEEHGRFIDMKRLKAVIPSKSDNEYVREIEDWIIARGWTQQFIAAYMRRRKLRKVPPSVLRRIAWGIVISRAKKVRPRKWYNGYKTATIPELFNRVAAGLPPVASEVLISHLKP